MKNSFIYKLRRLYDYLEINFNQNFQFFSVVGTINNKNNNSKKDLIEFFNDLIEFHPDSYNSSGVDVRELSENEKDRLISILKDEFLINSS